MSSSRPIALFTRKLFPPWDSAISAFTFNFVYALARYARRHFSETIVYTLAPDTDKYLEFYGERAKAHILDDLWLSLELLKGLRVAEIPGERFANHLWLAAGEASTFVVEPRLYEVLVCASRRGCRNLFLVPRRLRVRYYATYADPRSPRFLPAGVPVELFRGGGRWPEGEGLAESLKALRESVDYVAAFMGPVIGRRVSLLDVLRIVRLAEERYGVRLGVIGFVTVRYRRDRERVLRLVASIGSRLAERVRIEAVALSTRAKAALASATDLLLYPIRSPVDLADPPFTVLEWAACSRPSVFPRWGLLARVYPLEECMYTGYTPLRVAETVYRCMRAAERLSGELLPMVEELFSAKRLAEKIVEVLEAG